MKLKSSIDIFMDLSIVSPEHWSNSLRNVTTSLLYNHETLGPYPDGVLTHETDGSMSGLLIPEGYGLLIL